MIGWRTAAVVCLLALALPLQHRLAEASPGDSTKEKKKQQETCHDQCKETPNNNPHGLSYPCPLLNQLQYYATCNCVSQVPNGRPNDYGLTVAERDAMLAWISATAVYLEGCNGEINDTVIVEVTLSLQVFFEAHVTIKNALSFLSINDSSGVFFGTVQDIVSLHIVLQFQICAPVVVPDSNGDCDLSKAIEEAAAASGNQQIIDECHNVTEHIKSLIQHSEFNLTEQLSFIYQIIVQECSVETITFLKGNCHIVGFGSFISIFDICEVNFRIQTMNVYMVGSSSSDCQFLADIQDVFNSMCYPGTPNSAQCANLNDLMDKINVVFSASIDIEFRMEGCASVIFDMCKAAPWLCGMHLGRGGCSLYDILYCSAFCHNEGCCDWNDAPPELPDCSCDQPGESPTPPECDGTDPCEPGESPTPPECDGTGPCEPPTPPECDGTGPCEPPTPPECDGTGPCEPGESPTPPALPEETTPEEPAEETTVEVTVPPVTTTAPMSFCESRQFLIVIEVSCNCSRLYVSIKQVTDGWAFTQRQSFAPVLNQIQKILYDASKSLSQKLADIFEQINGWSPSNASWKTQLFEIMITKSDGTQWGKVSEFMGCGSSCTCSG